MAIKYGHRMTAFNGVWQWLQGRQFFKELPLKPNQSSWPEASKIMVEFMKSRNMKIVYHYRGKNKQQYYQDENSNVNAVQIQKVWNEFKKFVAENYEK